MASQRYLLAARLSIFSKNLFWYKEREPLNLYRDRDRDRLKFSVYQRTDAKVRRKSDTCKLTDTQRVTKVTSVIFQKL